MTNKEKYLHRLNQARLAHTHWVGTIKLLVSGLLKNKSDLELNISQITFGKWFYEDAMLLRDTSCTSVICEIEELWGDIHQQFMSIYEVCVLNKKKNIFGIEKPLNSSEKQLASHYYQDLIVLTDKLQNKLRIFEKQLNAKGEDEFKVFGNYLETGENLKNIELDKQRKEKEESKGGLSGARGAYLSD